MDKKIARVNWSRGQYSEVYRSAIIDPSPLKKGQKVKVIWGKTRKEYSAVVACYPVKEVKETQASENVLPPRRERAKRKLVSISWSLRLTLCKTCTLKNLILTQIPCFNSQTPESPPAAKKNAKASKENWPGQQKATKENCKQKEKPKGRVCTNKCSYKTYFRDSSCYVSFRLWLVSLHVRNSLHVCCTQLPVP